MLLPAATDHFGMRTADPCRSPPAADKHTALFALRDLWYNEATFTEETISTVKEILKILERNAHATPEQIAVMTGRDKGEIARLIDTAEKQGIIRRYKAVVDWERAGAERVFAFIDVRVAPQRGSGFDDVARRIYRFPEVHSVYLVSGQQDLRVVIEGPMRDVANFSP